MRAALKNRLRRIEDSLAPASTAGKVNVGYERNLFLVFGGVAGEPFVAPERGLSVGEDRALLEQVYAAP